VLLHASSKQHAMPPASRKRSLRERTPLLSSVIRASQSNPALRILLRALGFARDAPGIA
jgi:hypothetical protein